MPRAVPAICLGPSEVVTGSYIMLKEGTEQLEATGNVQLRGVTENLNQKLFELLVGPPDELNKFEPPPPELEPLFPRRWTCPACRGQHRAHTKMLGSCALADRPEDWVDEFRMPEIKSEEEDKCKIIDCSGEVPNKHHRYCKECRKVIRRTQYDLMYEGMYQHSLVT